MLPLTLLEAPQAIGCVDVAVDVVRERKISGGRVAAAGVLLRAQTSTRTRVAAAVDVVKEPRTGGRVVSGGVTIERPKTDGPC